MNIDAELDLWRREWQSDSAVPADLRRRVERQTRWMRLAVLVDVLVTCAIGGGVIVVAVRAPQAEYFVLAAATWLFLAAAWIFSLVVNRRNWCPAALDTEAFVDLSVRRCRARLAAVRFGVVLYLCEMVFCLSWIYRSGSVGKPVLKWLWFGSLAIDLVWLTTAAFAVVLIWYSRKKRAELAWLLSLGEHPE